MIRRISGASLLGLLLTAGVCDPGDPIAFVPEREEAYSFEQGLEGWVPAGTDLTGPNVPWSIAPSEEQASHGAHSLRIRVDNVNDAAKVWVQRPFVLASSQAYRVEVAYSFASRDFGDFNHWTLITGVHAAAPTSASDLTFQGPTANGSSTDVGHRWLERSHTFDVTAAADGTLWVVIGVWGTWETERTYYLDDVRVSFLRR